MTKLLREKFPKIVNTKFTASMESSLDKVARARRIILRCFMRFMTTST